MNTAPSLSSRVSSASVTSSVPPSLLRPHTNSHSTGRRSGSSRQTQASQSKFRNRRSHVSWPCALADDGTVGVLQLSDDWELMEFVPEPPDDDPLGLGNHASTALPVEGAPKEKSAQPARIAFATKDIVSITAEGTGGVCIMVMAAQDQCDIVTLCSVDDPERCVSEATTAWNAVSLRSAHNESLGGHAKPSREKVTTLSSPAEVLGEAERSGDGLSEWSPVTEDVLYRCHTVWCPNPDGTANANTTGSSQRHHQPSTGTGWFLPPGYAHVFQRCRATTRRLRPKSLLAYVSATHAMAPTALYPNPASVGSRDVCAIDVALRVDCVVLGVVVVTNAYGAELHACRATTTASRALPEPVTQCDYMLGEDRWGDADGGVPDGDTAPDNLTPFRSIYLAGSERFRCGGGDVPTTTAWHGPLRVLLHVADAPVLVRSVHVFTAPIGTQLEAAPTVAADRQMGLVLLAT